jgi:hypothetical protein
MWDELHGVVALATIPNSWIVSTGHPLRFRHQRSPGIRVATRLFLVRSRTDVCRQISPNKVTFIWEAELRSFTIDFGPQHPAPMGFCVWYWNSRGPTAIGFLMKKQEGSMEKAFYEIVSRGEKWVVLHDGKETGPYVTKEAALEAVVPAISLAIADGMAAQLNIEAGMKTPEVP